MPATADARLPADRKAPDRRKKGTSHRVRNQIVPPLSGPSDKTQRRKSPSDDLPDGSGSYEPQNSTSALVVRKRPASHTDDGLEHSEMNPRLSKKLRLPSPARPAPVRHFKKRAELEYSRARRQNEEEGRASISVLKDKIRNIKRLLEHSESTMPANIRIEKERELADYEQELQPLLERRDAKKTISKYHFVRFLERKKATKNLNVLLKQEQHLRDTVIDSFDLEAALEPLHSKIHKAQVDLNYTVYAPLNEKYMSLFPKDADESLDQKRKKIPRDPSSDPRNTEKGIKPWTVFENASGQKPPMWYTVEKCMEDNRLDVLREGKLNRPGFKKKDNSGSTVAAKTSTGSNNVQLGVRRKPNGKHNDLSRENQHDDESEDSDGGFFE